MTTNNGVSPCSKKMYRKFSGCLALAFTLTASPLWAVSSDLMNLGIEDLMNIEVTSVSGKGQNLSDSAAAIFVITQDDLKRSGVTNIPDALRMVPGLNVSRIDSNKWAVNSRGANSRFANKLLVMIDGRSVYTNAYSGVYWEVQDVLLEDVDRIEVIRGPGATLWGANAVNGVINIITRHTADTQGGYVELGTGTEEEVFGAARYGFELGDVSYMRLYAKGLGRDNFEYDTGDDAGDEWDMVRTGFRLDSNVNSECTLALQGEVYKGDISQKMFLESLELPYMYLVDDKTEVSGGHLLGRWHRIFSKTSEMTFQAYYDRTSRTEAYLAQELEVFDLDFQHRWRGIQKHDIIWGARYRYSKDDFVPSYVVTFDQESRNDELYSFFVQDEITLVDDRLWLTLGSKFEHNEYTGTEIQPSGRLLWIPKHNHRLWTSISRAVRTPSRLESDGLLVTAVMPPSEESFGLPVEVLFASDQTFDSENLTAYEVGYRFITDRNLSIDLTAFYNDYDELRAISEPTIIPQFLSPTPHVESLYYFVNDSQARSYGLELALAYQVTDWLQVDLGYSYINSDADFLAEEPTHQVSLRSAFKIRDDLDLDVWLRYVDKTRSLFTTNEDGYYEIDEYLACDIRLAWRPTEKLELSLVGQNLLDGGHLEFVQEKFTFPTELPRGVYGKVSYKF